MFIIKKIVAILCVLTFTLPIKSIDLENKTILWLGTSIPEGCTYPEYVCKTLGLTCINKALGASFLCMKPITPPFYYHTGLSLSTSSEEKGVLCQQYLDKGELDDEFLSAWKEASYDKRIGGGILEDADIIIIDHGYNDGDILEEEIKQSYSDIDWNSKDRTTFIGAFNYLYDIIKRNNPNAIVMIGGYFQNTCTFSYTKRGKYVSTICKWIADHYNIPLLDVWNYTNIPDGYIQNSENYLNELNEKYGTNYKKIFEDQNGNITHFQKFCPDGVHPFTDPTGESDKILNEIFYKLIYHYLSVYFPSTGIAEFNSKMENIEYNLNGQKVNAYHKGFTIRKNNKRITKYIK